MIQIITPNTAIRIKQKSICVNDEGHTIEKWEDIIDEDILCEWHNRHGMEKYEAASLQAKNPAYIRLWYIPGITADCRVVRLEDESVFEIIGEPDDVLNRHVILEIELKRYMQG